MHTNKRVAALMCLVGLLASGAALAQDNRFYVGFSAGQTRANFDGAPAVVGGLPTTYDNSTSVWKAFGGYQFNQYVSAELTYVQLGTYNANVNVLGTPMFTDINITGWGAALVGALPLGKGVSLLGRVGETRVRESRGTCSTLCVTNTTFSADNTWSPTFGIGLKYDFNPNLSARAEVERFTKVGSSDNTFGASINSYTVGLAYKF